MTAATSRVILSRRVEGGLPGDFDVLCGLWSDVVTQVAQTRTYRRDRTIAVAQQLAPYSIFVVVNIGMREWIPAFDGGTSSARAPIWQAHDKKGECEVRIQETSICRTKRGLSARRAQR